MGSSRQQQAAAGNSWRARATTGSSRQQQAAAEGSGRQQRAAASSSRQEQARAGSNRQLVAVKVFILHILFFLMYDFQFEKFQINTISLIYTSLFF